VNYKRIYNEIVTRAQKENRKKLLKEDKNYVYYEKHHIIPRCMKGTNNKDNLVLLTAREHFLCHWSLIEMYPEENKLKYAFWMMCFCKTDERDYYVSSRMYEYAKCEFIKSSTGLFKKGHKPKFSEAWKLNMSNAWDNKPLIKCPHCDMESKNVSNMYRFHFDNCKCSPNYNPTYIKCPHCDIKSTSKAAMKQWHFDNCKNK
jgi:hypothetical protein